MTALAAMLLSGSALVVVLAVLAVWTTSSVPKRSSLRLAGVSEFELPMLETSTPLLLLLGAPWLINVLVLASAAVMPKVAGSLALLIIMGLVAISVVVARAAAAAGVLLLLAGFAFAVGTGGGNPENLPRELLELFQHLSVLIEGSSFNGFEISREH